ncbi:hypothetical protein WA158_006523 [Blastocystis sp. Blastoise]
MKRTHEEELPVNESDAMPMDDEFEDEESTKGQIIPAFLTKTFAIMHNNQFQNIVRWNDAGDAILIEKVEEFSQTVLPKYFKHGNFASFVRQLNMYGFHKTRQDPNWREFQHPMFKRGRVDLLAHIKRKTGVGKQKPTPQVESTEVEVKREKLNTDKCIKDYNSLRRKQEEIEMKYNKLLQDNAVLYNIFLESKQRQDEMKKQMEKIYAFVYNIYSYVYPQLNGVRPRMMLTNDNNDMPPMDLSTVLSSLPLTNSLTNNLGNMNNAITNTSNNMNANNTLSNQLIPHPYNLPSPKSSDPFSFFSPANTNYSTNSFNGNSISSPSSLLSTTNNTNTMGTNNNNNINNINNNGNTNNNTFNVITPLVDVPNGFNNNNTMNSNTNNNNNINSPSFLSSNYLNSFNSKDTVSSLIASPAAKRLNVEPSVPSFSQDDYMFNEMPPQERNPFSLSRSNSALSRTPTDIPFFNPGDYESNSPLDINTTTINPELHSSMINDMSEMSQTQNSLKKRLDTIQNTLNNSFPTSMNLLSPSPLLSSNMSNTTNTSSNNTINTLNNTINALNAMNNNNNNMSNANLLNTINNLNNSNSVLYNNNNNNNNNNSVYSFNTDNNNNTINTANRSLNVPANPSSNEILPSGVSVSPVLSSTHSISINPLSISSPSSIGDTTNTINNTINAINSMNNAINNTDITTTINTTKPLATTLSTTSPAATNNNSSISDMNILNKDTESLSNITNNTQNITAEN